ncbi:MAG: TonB family protein [Candidatus Eisenbacteria bacterium]
MSAMIASLSSTLEQSAHRELKSEYPRLVVAGFLLAALIHVGLMLSHIPAIRPLPLPISPAEPGILELQNTEYRTIPEAAPVPRPKFADDDFDLIVSDAPDALEPLPPMPLDWAQPALAGETGTGVPEVFVAAPEVYPVPLHRVAPAYPELARLAGAEGRVVLEVWIDATGRVSDVRIAKSDVPATLERAALDAMRQWIFSPAKQGGNPVAVRVHVPIEFRLD